MFFNFHHSKVTILSQNNVPGSSSSHGPELDLQYVPELNLLQQLCRMDDPGLKVEQVDNRVGQGGSQVRRFCFLFLIIHFIQVIQSLQIVEENRNIDDNISNADLIATDSNENVSPGVRTSHEVKVEEPQIRVGDNVLEQIPSTESESSGCSQVIQETLTDIVDHDSESAVSTSNVLEDSEKADVPNNVVLGNSLGEPEKADKSGGGRTTPDSPSSIYQVYYELLPTTILAN